LSSLSALLELALPTGQGPWPSFTRAHFLLAFLTIGERDSIGRQALAKEVGLGEGSVRTLLRKLTEEGYAKINSAGCHLTTSSRAIYSRVKERLSLVVGLEGTTLTVGSNQVAVKVKGGARGVLNGIQQRDAAIMLGAAGATTYVIRKGRFTVPGGSADCEKNFPSSAWKLLRSELSPGDGDAVVLCGAEDSMRAKLGALSAALTLL